VLESGAQVPTERRLDDLTQELFEMLGDPDPALREELACAVLSRWLRQGVYDDLLTGLADGAASGLVYRLGDDGTDSVFRRACSARILAEAIARNHVTDVAGPELVLAWGDRTAGWLVRERDLRAHIPGKGWARAPAHGADVLGMVARSRHLGVAELTVLLDVVADRLLTPTHYRLVDGETDRLAHAVMVILHRNLVPQKVLDPWVARLAAAIRPVGPAADPEPRSAAVHNTDAFLRSLHLTLAAGVRPQQVNGDDVLFGAPPTVRADLILSVLEALRASVPALFR